MSETWGPDAVIGTSRHGLSASKETIGRTRFQGPSSALRTLHKSQRSSSRVVFLNITFFHTNHKKFKQKRQLCPRRSPACSPPPIMQKCVSPLCPCPCARILTGFPFANASAIAASLRNDSPTSNQCSRGTLPHFALQGSRLNICYYHQDLH